MGLGIVRIGDSDFNDFWGELGNSTEICDGAIPPRDYKSSSTAFLTFDSHRFDGQTAPDGTRADPNFRARGGQECSSHGGLADGQGESRGGA